MSRAQLRRWASAVAAGFQEGFAGPALGLAIQAQLPAQAPGVRPASTQQDAKRASRAAALTGVQA